MLGHFGLGNLGKDSRAIHWQRGGGRVEAEEGEGATWQERAVSSVSDWPTWKLQGQVGRGIWADGFMSLAFERGFNEDS